jgi:hypothetical protein
MQTGEIKKTTSIKFKNGNIYDGEFKGDLPNGTGKCNYANGKIYEGQYKDGKRHGKGKFTYANGGTYEGEFKGGRIHGIGILKYANGDIYNGDFKGDLPNGTGKCNYANGKIYEGQYKDGKRHGKGKFTYANGGTYEGEFKDGLPNGKGMLKYADGDIYDGEFKDGYKFIYTAKQKSENKTTTLVFQSSKMQCKESEKWGRGRFTNEDEFTTSHCNINDTKEVIAKLNDLAKVNEGESTKFKLVFYQHGDKGGNNNIDVNNESAKQMLHILYSRCYRDITISDLSCYGATASHFKGIIQEFVNTNSEVNVTIHAAPEGRAIISCNSNNGTKFRSIGTDGEAQKREKTVYKSNLTSGEKDKESKEPHPSNASIANSNIQNLESNGVCKKRSNVDRQSSDKKRKGPSTFKRQRL